MTYISKFMLENPKLTGDEVGAELLHRAKIAYEYFDSNNLFFIEDDSIRGHIFFDGSYTLEVTKDFVKFHFDIESRLFTQVKVAGQTLVRFDRELKPEIYHPIFECGYKRRSGALSDSEISLVNKYPGIIKHCIYNRMAGWTIHLTHHDYPFVPGLSIAMHTVKMCKWFKEHYKIWTAVTSVHQTNHISQLRFIF